ncbi:MAG: thiamine-phosphate kinase [Planctomycetota bacterium]|nr:thiamine-phosphate kinase [Planctomycetota bacterium]MDA1261959.1 thiamine-phosphate kinase [Planctomycetota bacterium]
MNRHTEGDRVNEKEILELAAAANGELPKHILIPPGDDMALVQLTSSQVLVAVDQVVAGRHFTANTPLDLIARKAVARNASDVAAMAGIPVATLASVTLPHSIGAEGARELLESVRKYAAEFGCPLIGGDTSVHHDPQGPLTLSVTILASPRADGIVVKRHGAKIGDRLIVSGPLGGSFAEDGLGHHLTFTPRIAEAHKLVDTLRQDLHAMIDISDGLGRDTARIIDASTKHSGIAMQARLSGGLIPCNRGLLLRHALSDGEDHELLAAIDKNAKVPFGWTEIGTIIERESKDQRRVLVQCADSLEDATNLGWLH